MNKFNLVLLGFLLLLSNSLCGQTEGLELEVEQIATIGNTAIELDSYNGFLSEIRTRVENSTEKVNPVKLKIRLSEVMVGQKILEKYFELIPVETTSEEITTARDILGTNYAYLISETDIQNEFGTFLNDYLRLQIAFVKHLKSRIPEVSSQDIDTFLSSHPGYRSRTVTDELRNEARELIYKRRVRSVVLTAFKELYSTYEVDNHLAIRYKILPTSGPGITLSGPPGPGTTPSKAGRQLSNILELFMPL